MQCETNVQVDPLSVSFIPFFGNDDDDDDYGKSL